MPFRFYTNMMSEASRTVAAGLMIVGLLLMGFGVIIVALPELFALLAALVFFIAGVGCAITAIRIFWAQRQFDRMTSDDPRLYRKNVRVRRDEPYDL